MRPDKRFFEAIPMNIESLENEVKEYWTERMPSFSQVRKDELQNEIGRKWQQALVRELPKDRYLHILDVGTGTGFFALLLAEEGYRVTGIDLTPAMIEEAGREANDVHAKATFMVMDAQKLSFADGSFDAVITRNLTWTLPEPEEAYREWHRVLRKGGKLINYDANYAKALRNGATKRTMSGCDIAYGHTGVTAQMTEENNKITLAMPVGMQERPSWDQNLLESIGFTLVATDLEEAQRILGGSQ